MIPNEFRRGNLLMDKVSGEWTILNEAGANNYATLFNKERYPVKNGRQIIPIPISLEILDKCDKLQLQKAQGLTQVFVANPTRLWWLGIEETKHEIKTLHELQNWYYATTGEELKIKYEQVDGIC